MEGVTFDDILPILFASCDNKILGKTRLTKGVFLLIHEVFEDLIEESEFFSYQFGPYSVKLASKVNKLVRSQEFKLKPQNGDYLQSLSPELISVGSEKLKQMDEKIKLKIEDLAYDIQNQNLNQLMNYVYTVYPGYIGESRINQELLEDSKKINYLGTLDPTFEEEKMFQTALNDFEEGNYVEIDLDAL